MFKIRKASNCLLTFIVKKNDQRKGLISFKQILINHSKRDLIYVKGRTGVGVRGGGVSEEEKIINVESF